MIRWPKVGLFTFAAAFVSLIVKIRGPKAGLTVALVLVAAALIPAAQRRFAPRVDRLYQKRWGFPASLGAFFFACALLPIWIDVVEEELAVQIGLFALLALGLNVVVGFAGLLDLGYVAFWAIGAYTMGIFSGAGPLQFAHLSMWQIFPIALAMALITGFLLGAPTLRLRGDYLAIVTLGFGEIVRIVAENLSKVTNGSQGIVNIPSASIPNSSSFWRGIVSAFVHFENAWIHSWNALTPGAGRGTLPVPSARSLEFGVNPIPYYLLLLAVIMIMVIVIRRLNNSRVGRAWSAIREDEVAAEAMGVPTLKYKLWAFSIGASTACISGVILAARIQSIEPGTFDLITSIVILSAVVLGGLGNISGALIGGTAVTFLPELLRSLPPRLQDARFGIFGAVLVLMMIYRPQGIAPSRRRAAELEGGAAETHGPIGAGLPEELAAGGAE
ncbi:MAG: branched-chain amino acid ABC transporter permease [Actinomycetota bacterium]|nr:branched-chain amino acid ABC transporter permease [Actinomycetota bacterium]